MFQPKHTFASVIHELREGLSAGTILLSTEELEKEHQNEQALEMLVDRYKNIIYSIPIRFGLSPQEAGIVFQGVFLDLFNELPRVREGEDLRAWITRATFRKTLEWTRQHNSAEMNAAATDLEVFELGSYTATEEPQELEPRQILEQVLVQHREAILQLLREAPETDRLGHAPGFATARSRWFEDLRRVLQGEGI